MPREKSEPVTRPAIADQWRLARENKIRSDQGLFRERLRLESAQGPIVQIEGQSFLCFCSNDYLGLANHPALKRAFQSAVERYGVGAGASHLICGHQNPHHELENALAEFTGRDRALVFTSGYQANLGILTALLGHGDAVFQDRLNHASLLDGGLLSGARFRRYPHADAKALARLLVGKRFRRCIIASDGVFSMDGDIAPLPGLTEVCAHAGACLMIDDAHGFGVIGHKGRGSTAHFGLTQSDVPILMATLSKAFGLSGAFVAGPAELIETLIQHARTYIYTTAMPPAIAAACLESLRLIREGDERRTHLTRLVEQFQSGAKAIGLPLKHSKTPIQPILLGNSDKALRWAQHLRARRILVTAIRPPTVPMGSARLRVTLTASHSHDQVDELLGALKDIAEK